MSAATDLASRLKRCRAGSGMTQRALGNAIGLGVHRVGDIERAKVLPTPGEIEAWCWTTGCNDQNQELIALAGSKQPQVEVYA